MAKTAEEIFRDLYECRDPQCPAHNVDFDDIVSDSVIFYEGPDVVLPGIDLSSIEPLPQCEVHDAVSPE